MPLNDLITQINAFPTRLPVRQSVDQTLALGIVTGDQNPFSRFLAERTERSRAADSQRPSAQQKLAPARKSHTVANRQKRVQPQQIRTTTTSQNRSEKQSPVSASTAEDFQKTNTEISRSEPSRKNVKPHENVKPENAETTNNETRQSEIVPPIIPLNELTSLDDNTLPNSALSNVVTTLQQTPLIPPVYLAEAAGEQFINLENTEEEITSQTNANKLPVPPSGLFITLPNTLTADENEIVNHQITETAEFNDSSTPLLPPKFFVDGQKTPPSSTERPASTPGSKIEFAIPSDATVAGNSELNVSDEFANVLPFSTEGQLSTEEQAEAASRNELRSHVENADKTTEQSAKNNPLIGSHHSTQTASQSTVSSAANTENSTTPIETEELVNVEAPASKITNQTTTKKTKHDSTEKNQPSTELQELTTISTQSNSALQSPLTESPLRIVTNNETPIQAEKLAPKSNSQNSSVNAISGLPTEPVSSQNRVIGSGKSSGTTTGNPLDLTTTESADRFANFVQSALQKSRPLRIRLSPPELGAMHIEVSSRGGTVTARLTVQTSAAQKTVLDNLPMLQESLTQNGTVIDRIEVQLNDFFNDDQPLDSPEQQADTEQQHEEQQQTDSEQHEEQQQSTEPHQHEPQTTADIPTTNTPGSHLEELDLQV